MTKYTNTLTAEQLITFIANDYVELSHDKIRWQRDEHMKICGEWLKHQASLIELDPELRDWEYDDAGNKVYKGTNDVVKDNF